MATLSLRIRDVLKRKAQDLAKRQGVSLNNYINATIAAAVAQEEALAFFEDRLRTVDLAALHRRVMAFMSKERLGREPSQTEVDHAIRGR
jgi:antitoxin component of RelBE/YafQ-DinJ toxin-antitoxin module